MPELRTNRTQHYRFIIPNEDILPAAQESDTAPVQETTDSFEKGTNPLDGLGDSDDEHLPVNAAPPGTQDTPAFYAYSHSTTHGISGTENSGADNDARAIVDYDRTVRGRHLRNWAILLAAFVATVIAACLLCWGIDRMHHAAPDTAPTYDASALRYQVKSVFRHEVDPHTYADPVVVTVTFTITNTGTVPVVVPGVTETLIDTNGHLYHVNNMRWIGLESTNVLAPGDMVAIQGESDVPVTAHPNRFSITPDPDPNTAAVGKHLVFALPPLR